MTHRSSLFAGMVALSAAAACPALADVYYVTYTGTVSGTDTNGVFGAAGAALSNVAFTSTYTYDPSQFGNAYYHTSTSSVMLYGGTYNGTTDPLLSASITINGITYHQGSVYSGSFDIDSSGTSDLKNQAYSSAFNFLANYAYFTGSPALSLTATQSFPNLLPSSGPGYEGYFAYNSEYLYLTNTAVSVTDGPPATVPEPNSLALLGSVAAVFALAVSTWRTRGGLGRRPATSRARGCYALPASAAAYLSMYPTKAKICRPASVSSYRS